MAVVTESSLASDNQIVRHFKREKPGWGPWSDDRDGNMVPPESTESTEPTTDTPSQGESGTENRFVHLN
jgi:hypothetical protein